MHLTRHERAGVPTVRLHRAPNFRGGPNFRIDLYSGFVVSVEGEQHRTLFPSNSCDREEEEIKMGWA
jgi:hypothetical protein